MTDIFGYDTRKKDIGERIRTLRKDRKYTQAGLAGKLSQIIPNDKEHPIGQSTIASWENGVTLPPLNRLIALSIIFNCDVSYLLCDYDIENQNIEYIKKTTGLSEDSVKLLRSRKQCGFIPEARVIDLLLWDVQKRNKSHHYRSILDLLSFFFRYKNTTHSSKQVFVNGAIVDYNNNGSITPSAIAINSRIVENAVLMELEQALMSLKKTVYISEENNG